MTFFNKLILIISTAIFCSNFCTGATTTQISSLNRQTDTVARLTCLDSIFESNTNCYNNILSTNNILKGCVQAMRIDRPNVHEIFNFPVKYLEFDKEGKLIYWNQYFGSAFSNDIKIDNLQNSVTVSNIIDLNTSEYEKHNAGFHIDGNHIVFEFEDSFGDLPNKEKFDFIYDEKGKLYKVIKHTAMIDDYEGLNELIEYDNEYSVSINTEDEFGNWTSITLNSPEEKVIYKRELFYYKEEQ